MGERLGPAGVQYGDLRGTVSIDEPDDDDRLYELAGLPKDAWHIVAYEIYGSYDTTYAHVWAVPTSEADFEVWEQQAREGREAVAAKRFDFQVEDDAAALTLLKLNKRWSIHALHRSLADLNLDVEHDD